MQDLQDLSLEELERLTAPNPLAKQTIPLHQQQQSSLDQKPTRARRIGGLKKSVSNKDKAPLETDTPAPVKRVSKDQIRLQNLLGIYATIGAGLMMVNQVDALIVLSKSEEAAQAVLAVAKLHPEIMRWIDSIGKYSAYTMLVTVHGAMIFAIAKNHNAIPTNFLNPFAHKEHTPQESSPETTFKEDYDKQYPGYNNELFTGHI